MNSIESTTIGTITPFSLEQRRDTLHERLNAGFDTIERAASQGEDVARWEQAWLRLLGEYQEVCDEIEAHRGSYARAI